MFMVFKCMEQSSTTAVYWSVDRDEVLDRQGVQQSKTSLLYKYQII